MPADEEEPGTMNYHLCNNHVQVGLGAPLVEPVLGLKLAEADVLLVHVDVLRLYAAEGGTFPPATIQ